MGWTRGKNGRERLLKRADVLRVEVGRRRGRPRLRVEVGRRRGRSRLRVEGGRRRGRSRLRVEG